MSVQSISVLISVTIADIWTKFYIEFKHHTINMTECSKFTRLWTSATVLYFDASRPCISENVNNSELDRAICAKFGVDNTWPKLETGTFYCVTSIRSIYYTNVGNTIDTLMSIRALNFQIFSLSLCRTHLFALFLRLLMCHSLLLTNFNNTANIIYKNCTQSI